MGYIKRPGEGIGSSILKTTDQLKSFASLSAETPELEKKTKKEYREKSEPLRANMATADAVKSKDAEPLQDQLHLNMLALQDPIQAAMAERVLREHAESLELIAQGKPPITSLEDKEVRTLYALARDQLSREEAHMLRLIEPLMTPQQREGYFGVRQSDYVKERSAPSTRETAKIGAEVVSPLLLPTGMLTLGKAAGLSGHPLTIAIAVSATVGMMGVEYMQKNVTATRGANFYGVNVLEDPSLGNDLLRMKNLAEETAKLPPEKRNVEGLERDLAVFDQLLEMRKDALGDKDDARVVAMFSSHASALRSAIASAGNGKIPADFAKSEASFLAATSTVDLSALSANLKPTGQISEEDFRKGMNAVVDGLSRQLLQTTNPALERTLARLDAQYKIGEQLEDGVKSPRLPENEIAALRAIVSSNANFSETLGIAPLVIAGAVELKDIWPNATIQISETETLDARVLLKDIEKARFGKEGDQLQMLAKFVDYGSTGLSIASMSAVLLLGGGLFSIPASVIPRLLGVLGANKLKQKGLELEALQNVDLAKGRPMVNEYELVLDRMREPAALLEGDAAAIKKRFGEEVALMQSLFQSMEHDLSFLDDAGRESFMKLRGPIYGSLVEMGTKLHELANSDAEVSQLRAGFTEAWSKLFSPDVLRTVNASLVRESAFADVETDTFTRYSTAKLQMLERAVTIVSSRTESFAEVVQGWEKHGVHNTEIFRQAQELRDLRQQVEAQRGKGALNYVKKKLGMYKGAEIDAVDRFAMSIIEERFKAASLPAIIEIAKDPQKIAASVQKELETRWPINEDRSKEIAGELLAVVLERTMAAVGPWSAVDAPKVKLKAEIDPPSDHPPFTVKAEIKGGGSMSVVVNAMGICEPDQIKIDLGENILSRVASHAVANHAAFSQSAIDVKSTELVQKDGEDYVFRVTTRDRQTFNVAVTPDGFARYDSIR
jgi:hypothetical protein